MFYKVILIGRLRQNAEAKTTQNNREFVVLNIATQESWKNDKGDFEPAPKGIASLPGPISPSSRGPFRKGSSLHMKALRYREYEEEVQGLTGKHHHNELRLVHQSEWFR
jgi:single-strand DNA-binding protein